MKGYFKTYKVVEAVDNMSSFLEDNHCLLLPREIALKLFPDDNVNFKCTEPYYKRGKNREQQYLLRRLYLLVDEKIYDKAVEYFFTEFKEDIEIWEEKFGKCKDEGYKIELYKSLSFTYSSFAFPDKPRMLQEKYFGYLRDIIIDLEGTYNGNEKVKEIIEEMKFSLDSIVPFEIINVEDLLWVETCGRVTDYISKFKPLMMENKLVKDKFPSDDLELIGQYHYIRHRNKFYNSYNLSMVGITIEQYKELYDYFFKEMSDSTSHIIVKIMITDNIEEKSSLYEGLYFEIEANSLHYDITMIPSYIIEFVENELKSEEASKLDTETMKYLLSIRNSYVPFKFFNI